MVTAGHVAVWLLLFEASDGLLGRPADTSPQRVARFPFAAETECFAGEQHGRAFAEGSGSGLVAFSAFATFWGRGCAEGGWRTMYNGSASAPWYSGGCSLFNGVFAAKPAAAWPSAQVRQRSDSFVSSQAYDELERLAAERPVSPAMREAERRLHAARRSGSRADWGVSIAPDGRSVLFGVGRRLFAHSTKGGTPLGAARGVVDGTLRATLGATNLFDGRWHDVLAARTVDGDGGSALALYVDGALVASGPGTPAQEAGGASPWSATTASSFDGGGGVGQGRKRVRNSQLQRLLSRSFSTRFG